MAFPSHTEALHGRKTRSPWPLGWGRRGRSPLRVLNRSTDTSISLLVHIPNPTSPFKKPFLHAHSSAEETACFPFKSLILIHSFYRHPPALENTDTARGIAERCRPEPAAPWPRQLPASRAGSPQEGGCKAGEQPPKGRAAFLRSRSHPTRATAAPRSPARLLLSLAFKMFSNFRRTNKQNPGGSPLNSPQDPRLVDIHQQEMSATSEQLV